MSGTRKKTLLREYFRLLHFSQTRRSALGILRRFFACSYAWRLIGLESISFFIPMFWMTSLILTNFRSLFVSLPFLDSFECIWFEILYLQFGIRSCFAAGPTFHALAHMDTTKILKKNLESLKKLSFEWEKNWRWKWMNEPLTIVRRKLTEVLFKF